MAKEIPDVVTGEVIASQWGNKIRDRTIQRYASAAARAAAVPSPVEGDLSYLMDTNGIEVYTGAGWGIPLPLGTVGPTYLATTIAQNLIVFGGADDDSPSSLSTTASPRASVVFTKPATWATYDLMAWGIGTGQGPNILNARAAIGASNGNSMTIIPATSAPTSIPVFHNVVGGSTTPITIAVELWETGGDMSYLASTIQYLAIRKT